MESQMRISLASVVIVFAVIMVVIASAVGIGSFVGFTARDAEVDGWRQAYKQIATNVPEWVHGTDKKYGEFSLVTFDHGKNYYAAEKEKDGQVLVISFAENVYPGLLARLKQASKLEKKPPKTHKKKDTIMA